MKFNCCPLDKYQLEVVSRICLTFLCGFSLAVAAIPDAVPPAFASVVGIASCILANITPKLQFAVGMMFPTVYVLFAIILSGTTALLAAATVSDGLMTGVYAVYTLFFTVGFNFGKGYEKTWGVSAHICTFAGMLCTSFRSTVQNGLSASHNALDGGDNPLETTSGLTRLILTALCRAQQGVSLEECNVQNLQAQAAGQLPEDLGNNALAGQHIVVTLDDGTLSANVAGGLWLVSAFWTEQGLTNPLAAWRNFFIALSWALIAVTCSILLPFPRTVRAMLGTMAVPAAMSQLIKMLSGDEETATEIQDNIAPLWGVMSNGDKAKLIAFEPRLCRAPFENIEPQLQELMSRVDQTILASILIVDASKRDEIKSPEVVHEHLERASGLLKASAKALSSGAADDTEEVETLRKGKADESGSSFAGHSGLIQTRCEDVADASIDWLHALDYKNKTRLSTKEKIANLRKTYSPWLMNALSLVKKTLQTFTIAFKPESWSLRSLLWSVERAGGFVALFCMLVYWPAYANFRFQSSEKYPIGGVFSGWELYGYAFAWQATMEGTIKKSIERIIGTCLGGFLAWLGAIVCSGSYDDYAPINPYGFVAWLTVTCTIVSAFGVNKGVKAFMGIDYDHGKSVVYAVLVETVVGLDIYVHDGSKNDLTVNRIVATLVGVLMAVAISIIPPNVRGGDPEHSRRYLASLEDAVARFLKDVADGSFDMEATELYNVYFKEADEKGKRAALLLKDAGKLGFLKSKFLKPDGRLKPLLQDMLMTESLFSQLVEQCKLVTEKSEEDWPGICSAAKQISEEGAASFGADEAEGGDGVYRKCFISWTRTLQVCLKKHERVLDEICGSQPAEEPAFDV